jgi:hypothetical protein
MKNTILKKPCPKCSTTIGICFFSNRKKIIRCPKCNELLIENPKRKQIAVVINLLGLMVGIGGTHWPGISLLSGFLVIIISFLLPFKITSLTIVTKDLVVRNKETNEISYIDITDWIDISLNSTSKKNSFEIIEELNNTLTQKKVVNKVGAVDN